MNTFKRIAKYFLACLPFIFLHEHAKSQCNPPSQFSIYQYSITPTSAIVFVTQNFSVHYVIEFGITGFTPGTDSLPGPGGTVKIVSGNYSQDSLSGLQPDTHYDCYIRTKCSAVLYSANSSVQTFKTQMLCNSVTIPLDVMITDNLATGVGSWSNCSGSGAEKIYEFTATYSGEYVLFADSCASWTEYYYKNASGGCTFSGWTCINTQYYQTSQGAFGPLVAGDTYFIAADPNTTSLSFDIRFRIEQPDCSRPTGVIETNATPSSFIVQWDSAISGVLEYGPHNFVPGINGTAGIGGTVVYVNGTSKLLTNLSGTFDVYVRGDCGNGNYSANSQRLWASTAACPQSINYSSFGSPTTVMEWGGTGYWQDYSNFWNCNYYDTMYGKENFVHFIAPCSGNLDLRIEHDPNYYFITLIKPSNGFCDLSGADCMPRHYQDYFVDSFYITGLIAGNPYDLILDVLDTSTGWFNSLDVTLGIPKPVPAIVNIQPTSFEVAWTCSCSNAYVEYGPPGFTPGTGANPGIGGIVIPNAVSPTLISGLNPLSFYDVYVRGVCGGYFSINSALIHQRTAQDCASAQHISCGTNLIYPATWNDNGAWWNDACGFNVNNSREEIYSFTSTHNGNSSIIVTGAGGHYSGGTVTTGFYFKADTNVCNEAGWQCIGNETYWYAHSIIDTLNFGPLDSGMTYFLMIDSRNPTHEFHRISFRLECPDVCSVPLLTSISSITPTSARVNGGCCLGDLFIEYGPAGFIPGTDSLPGGGIVIPHVTVPYSLTGLSPGITYDVYARQSCSSLYSFSPNSDTLSFTTCSSAPDSIITSAPNNIICPGGSVTLQQAGGDLVPGGQYKWYTGTCGGVLIGTGDSIVITPSATANYFVRGEALCGNTNCAYKTIYVFSDSIAPLQATTFCTGGMTTLFVTPVVNGSTYQWMNNGISINGATNSQFIADTSGNFTCQVINGMCMDTSNAITTLESNFISPVLTINGPDSICAGQVVWITSTNYGGGNYSYQWTRDTSIIIGATSYNYQANQPGAYQVTVTNGTCSGTSNTLTLYLSSPFTASATANGPLNLCTGDSVILIAYPSASGYTFQWRKNGINLPGETNDSLTVYLAGSYEVVVRNSGYCSDTSSSIPVTVNTNPSISISSTNTLFCSGDSVVLVASAFSATSLQWQLNGVNIPGAIDTFYFAFVNGSYNCIASNACGSFSSNSIQLTEDFVPVPTISGIGTIHICEGDTAFLNTTFITGYAYQWTKNLQTIAGATSNVYGATTSGRYRVQVTDSNGCQNFSALRMVLVSCIHPPPPPPPDRYADQHSNLTFDATVFPNPGRELFTLNVISATEKNYSLVVMDVLGREVERWKDVPIHTEFSFGSSLRPGIYIAEISAGEQRKILRVVKED